MSIGLAVSLDLGQGRAVSTPPFARDTFTDVDGTALTSHTPELGSWTKNTTSSNNTAAPSIDGNRVHGENAATASLYEIATPTTANYSVFCDVVMRSDNNLSTCGPVGRSVSNFVTYYHARYNANGNVWQLFKWVANTATQLGTNQAATLVVDQAYRAELRMRGSTIEMVVDGVVLVSVTDTAISAAGAAGIKLAGAATSTTGVHLDNLLVTAA